VEGGLTSLLRDPGVQKAIPYLAWAQALVATVGSLMARRGVRPAAVQPVLAPADPHGSAGADHRSRHPPRATGTCAPYVLPKAEGTQDRYWEMLDALFEAHTEWGERQAAQTAVFIELAIARARRGCVRGCPGASG
jgi:hypothetical protein